MANLRTTAHNYLGIFVIPLWVGLLALPFTGIGGAARVTAAAVVAMLLGKMLRINAVTAVRTAATETFSKAFASFPLITRYSSAPLTYALCAVLLIVLPLFLNDYYRDIMTLTGMYVVLALGLNVVVGQVGLLNLGYVAFYAIGAYTYAILSTTVGLSFWFGLIAGGLVAAIFAVVLGMPILRLRGDYFAIVTLGLGEITRIILNNEDTLTGGPNGISNIGRPVLAGYELHTALDFYYLILAIASLTVFAMRRLIASRIGRAWIAIREDEIAAEAMGLNTYQLKLLAFVLASSLAGVVGVFFSAKMAFVSPESFTFFESVLILCMVVLGGMGSIPGIILGALLLIALPELFRDFQDYRMLAFGAALVLMMVFRPRGLLGGVKRTV